MIEKATKAQQLSNLERDMEQNKKTLTDQWQKAGSQWFEFCKGLWKIREGKLYEPEYHTFSQYALQRWNIKRSRALQLCRTYENLKNVRSPEFMDLLLERSGISEFAAQQLTYVPEEQREEIIHEVVEEGKVTARAIKVAARKKRKLVVKDAIEKDKIGRDIPGPAMPVWDRRKELNPRIRPLFELKQWANDMQGSDDVLYRGMDFGAIMRETAQLILMLQQGIPDVVCTKCQGQATATCDFCYGRGMVSISKARAYTPVELKEMIDRQTNSDDSTERLSATGG